MRERRKKRDRRSSYKCNPRLFNCSRSTRPDRRLNNIASEWIPMEHVNIHPKTRLVFVKG